VPGVVNATTITAIAARATREGAISTIPTEVSADDAAAND
jgi:hypothetical protein